MYDWSGWFNLGFCYDLCFLFKENIDPNRVKNNKQHQLGATKFHEIEHREKGKKYIGKTKTYKTYDSTQSYLMFWQHR